MLAYKSTNLFGKLLAWLFGIWFRWRMSSEASRTDPGMMARVLEPILKTAHWGIFEKKDVAYIYPLHREGE